MCEWEGVSMCVLRRCPPVRQLCLILHPVRWLLRRRLVLVLALLNRQRQPRLSASLVGMMELKFQHGPGSEARLTATACASICCVCRVNVETLTWTSAKHRTISSRSLTRTRARTRKKFPTPTPSRRGDEDPLQDKWSLSGPSIHPGWIR